jgi:glycosyltransferase involved in cell wall biosynthesis
MSYSQYELTVNESLTICCVIPARNEAGYLEELVDQILSVDEIAEVIIVEGGSKDNTWQICKLLEKNNPGKIKALQQSKTGKFNAVIEGAKKSTSSLILIWDADGTVVKKDVIKVINLSLETKCPVMGNRLKGNIELGAMRSANKIGNWAFALAWSPLLGWKPVDLLCGTKIFPKQVLTELPHWLQIADPYGDFALIANSRKQGLEIKSLRVDYFARKYGASNIHRWRGGVRLLMCTFAVYLWMAAPSKKYKKANND